MSSSDPESPSDPESSSDPESPVAEPADALSGASPQQPSEDSPTTPTNELELPENDTGKSLEDLTEEVPLESGAIADVAQNPPDDLVV